LVNRTPSTVIDYKTPYEVWSGKPADYTGLCVFGCPAYYHVSEGKLEPRSKKGLFMGYGAGVKGYRIWSPAERRVIFSRDVIFDENSMLTSTPQEPVQATSSSPEKDVSEKVEVVSERVSEQVEPITIEADDKDVSDQQSEPAITQQPSSIATDRPQRQRRAPVRYGFEDMLAYALHTAEEVEFCEPANFKEAVNSKHADEWSGAMSEEMESLHKNRTWELVKPPSNRKIVSCKWIYKRKDGLSETEPVRFKARLVARGYSQEFGVDYMKSSHRWCDIPRFVCYWPW
jgi:hypothetical protein